MRLARVPHERRLLDQRRRARGDVRRLRARPAAQRRHDGHHQLRPGRLHGDRRRTRWGSSSCARDSSFWLAMLGGDRRRRWSRPCSSACRRSACGRTTSRSRRSPSARSSATSPTTGTGSRAATWVCSATRTAGSRSSVRIDGWLEHLGIDVTSFLLPLLVVNLALFLVLTAARRRCSCARRGGASSARSARTRTQRARSARTRSSTSCSRSRSSAALAALAGLHARDQLSTLLARRVRPGLHHLRVRDRDPRRARQLLRRPRRLVRPDVAARGDALSSSSRCRGPGRGAPVHHRRRSSSCSHGVPSAGASSASARRCCSCDRG